MCARARLPPHSLLFLFSYIVAQGAFISLPKAFGKRKRREKEWPQFGRQSVFFFFFFVGPTHKYFLPPRPGLALVTIISVSGTEAT